MLRVKIIASVIPLIVVGVLARDRMLHDTRPCIAVGDSSVQLAIGAWQNPMHVAFTDNASAASVKVQLVDSADIADFAIVDDTDSHGNDSCVVNAATRFVAIDDRASDTPTRIHLSTEDGGDYRVFVNSRRFTAWEAAALIVAARDSRHRLASAF